MKTPTNSARTLGSVRTAGGGALLLLALAGCSGGGDEGKTVQALSPTEFRAAGVAPESSTPGGAVKVEAESKPDGASRNVAGERAVESVAVNPVERPTTPAVPPSKPAPVSAPAATGPRVVAVAGDAPRLDSGSKAVGRDVLADCMVGQINGRPVFASEILDPLNGRLAAAAKDVKGAPSAQVWIRDAAKLIRMAVELRVRDELLLGEARARLSPEQKQGLLYFIQRVDQWASGQSGGSREQAQEAIKNRTGEDYDKFLQGQRDQTLIRDLIRENVTPFVRVPWRKVERYYADNQVQLNPPPFAVVRIVMIDASNTEAVARAQAAAGATDGGAFKEVALSEANVYERTKAGLVVKPLEKGYEKIEWVGNKTWNEAASKLTVGHYAGPIDTATFKVFIRREDDYITPHRTLEDAQLEIVTRLTNAKETQEQNEFFLQLLGKGSFTPVGRMTLELLVLAAQRHLPPDLAGAVRDQNPLGVDTTPGLERSPTPATSLDDVSLNPPKSQPKPSPTPAAPVAPAVPPK